MLKVLKILSNSFSVNEHIVNSAEHLLIDEKFWEKHVIPS